MHLAGTSCLLRVAVRLAGCCHFYAFADRCTCCPHNWFIPANALLGDRAVTENITQFPSMIVVRFNQEMLVRCAEGGGTPQ